MRHGLKVIAFVATFAIGACSRSDGALIQIPPVELPSAFHAATPVPGGTSVHDALGRGDPRPTFGYSPGDTIDSTIMFPAGQQLVVTPGPGAARVPFDLQIELQWDPLPSSGGTFTNVSPEPDPVLTFEGLIGQAPGAPFYSYQAFHIASQAPGFTAYWQFTNLTAPFSFSSAHITLTVPDGAGSPENIWVYRVGINADETFSGSTDQPLLSFQPVPEPTIAAIILLPLISIRRC